MTHRIFLCLIFFIFSFYSLAESTDLSSLLEKAPFKNETKTEKKKPYKKIKSSLSKIKDLLFGPDWDIPLDLPPIALNKKAGLDLGLGYNYKTSYDGMTFVRTDTFKLGYSIAPGDLFQGLPLFLNISDKSQLSYKRRFKSMEEAKKAGALMKPFFPFNDKSALKNMRPGDIFSFPTTLTLALGANIAQMFPPAPILAGLSGQFFLSGVFKISIIALTEGRFRLKIESISEKGLSGTAYSTQAYTLTNINFVDGLINNVLHFDLLTLGISYTRKNQFILDYVFNFNDPEGKDAYNKILSSTLKFKLKKHFNPFNKGKLSSSRPLISMMTKADRLSKEDSSKPLEERRIMRIFKGTIDAHTTSAFMKLSAIAASTSLTSLYSRQLITSLNEFNEEKLYYFPSYMAIKRSGLILGKLSKFNFFLLSALYELDKDKNIKTFDSFGTLFFDRDFSFSKKDLKKFQTRLQLNLPESLYESISWPDHLKELKRKERGPLKNSLSMMQILLSKDVFQELWGMDYQTLRHEYKKFSKGLKERGLLKSPKYSKILLQNKISIRRMLKKIELILNTRPGQRYTTGKGVKKHIRKFMGLRASPLFKNLGLGFFLHLLKGEDLSPFVNIFALLNAEGHKGLLYSFGDGLKHHLFKTMRTVQLSPSIQPYDYKRIEYPKEDDQNKLSISKLELGLSL